MFSRLYFLKRKTNNALKDQYALLKETNAQLVARENELKKLNNTKDKYFSIIAHDIKNPLSALMNLSHIIIEKFDTLTDDKIQEFNKMIHESANNLHTLLENLLYWARANTNKIKYNPENIKLKTVINNIFLINKLSAIQKNIQLVDNTDNYEVYADLQMLTSIMRNLVSNAIKFTREGGKIEITGSNQGRTIDISIADNGVGMSEEDIDKLFRLDTHFSGRGTNNEAGTGLGLILVKEFVEKNQGKISVWSEPGKGSIFTFSIPNATW
jgi:signal transduction histidine kinase